MGDILDQLQSAGMQYASVDQSGLDPKVWVPHIPDSDIASSEGMATTSIRRAKTYTEDQYVRATGMERPTWVKVSPAMWILYDADDLEAN